MEKRGDINEAYTPRVARDATDKRAEVTSPATSEIDAPDAARRLADGAKSVMKPAK